MTDSLDAFQRRIARIRKGPPPPLPTRAPKLLEPFTCPFCDGTPASPRWICQRCGGTAKLETWDQCKPYAGGDYNGHCGGCDECMLMQVSGSHRA